VGEDTADKIRFKEPYVRVDLHQTASKLAIKIFFDNLLYFLVL